MERISNSVKKALPFLKWALLLLSILVLFGSLAFLYVRLGGSTGFGQKTFWDWLDLLIVPTVLAFGAWWVNRINQANELRRADRESQIERQIASERNQEAALQSYLDRMTDLLLKENLLDSQQSDLVRAVARPRTLTVLRGLEGERKGSVIRFLVEAGLITSGQEGPPVIALSEADLSGAILSGTNLSRADLRGAKLSQADLRRVNLHGAYLSGADLTEAVLSGADLTEADLSGAILINAHLDGADLSRATLRDARLTGVDLSGATLRGARLTMAHLSGAVLREAHMSQVHLNGTDLSGADLSRADLREADLSGSNLSRADLSGADVRWVSLSTAVLKEAAFDSNTMLPDGSHWTPGADMSVFVQPK